MDFYPSNTPSHYFTNLSQGINLTGDFEVGLSEILISNTYRNIEEQDECFFKCVRTETVPNQNNPQLTRLVSKTVVVPPGLYESNEFFINTLNTLTVQELGRQENNKPRVRFFYHKATKQVSVLVYEGTVTLSEKLQSVLSLNTQTIVGHRHVKGEGAINLNQDFQSVYIYCDLVSPRPVGDTMAPLLRIIPILDKKREVLRFIFEKPHYTPLSRFQFNTVEMILTTDKGKTLSFTSGTTITTLHFRRRRED